MQGAGLKESLIPEKWPNTVGGILTTLQAFYLLLFAGSLAFGLEAMLLGLGGRLPLLYGRRRWATLGWALGCGCAIIGLSIVTAAPFGLGPLYVCALVLGYTFLAGGVIRRFKARFIKPSLPRLPPPASEVEIRRMLRKRGLRALVKKKKR